VTPGTHHHYDLIFNSSAQPVRKYLQGTTSLSFLSSRQVCSHMFSLFSNLSL
jgi:hypothetical protein